MHALIIEDDYLIGRTIEDVLSGIGFATFNFARSEDAAVAAAAGQAPNLITADLKLLPGDGIEAVNNICAERQIPVVFVSGYIEDLQARVPGAISVGKPIKPEELTAAVKRALARA